MPAPSAAGAGVGTCLAVFSVIVAVAVFKSDVLEEEGGCDEADVEVDGDEEGMMVGVYV